MTEGILKHPRSELRSAAKAIETMKTARSLEDFEAEWRIFLNCLEKTWIKAERCCQPFRAKFEPWQRQYYTLRKKDMLLRYLKQARDADNHSVQDVTKVEPGHRAISFVNPRGGYIEHMELRGAEIVAYKGDPLIVEDKPPEPVAVPVKNSGEWYNPPTSHLGKPIASRHPLVLAYAGLEFYEKYVHEVERAFFEKAP
jgi:hypothetical protein